MSLKEDLQKILSFEILDDPETLEKYSKDASIFKISPKVVFFPKDTEDIKEIVKYASENNLSITVRSAGTDMSGAAIGEDIILDIGKYFNKLIKIDENSTIVQPGMLYRDFEVETIKQGLILPTYPASREICTVGGMVANNAGGELELTYGPINKYLKSMKVILSDGNEYTFSSLNKDQLNNKITQDNFEGKIYSEIYNLLEENKELVEKARPKTSKNSTGYDLWEVYDGESFDLSKLIIGSQGTLGIITEAEFKLIKPKKHQILLRISLPDLKQLDIVVKKTLEFKPEAFECFDDQTLNLALEHAWDISANFKHNNRLFAYLDMISGKKNALPKLMLLANFTSDDINEPYKDRMVYTLAGHIGDGNFHIIPLMDLSKEEVRAVIPELMEKVFKLVFEYKGSMSAEHNDGLIRGPYLPEMYGNDVYQLFKKVKEIFDPKNIFNPHKKVDATFEYSLKHMAKN